MGENLIDATPDVFDVLFLLIDLGGGLDGFHGGPDGDWDSGQGNSFEDHFFFPRRALRSFFSSIWMASTDRVFSGVFPYSTEIERGSW